MPTVKVFTTCTATVVEEWSYHTDDPEVLAALDAADDADALDLLTAAETAVLIGVDDEVSGEHDRETTSVVVSAAHECRHCGARVHHDSQGAWVDRSDGDGCDPGAHEPATGTPS